MKKLFGLVIMLFVIYLSIQVIFSFIGSGHSVDYKIDNDYKFDIHEEYTTNSKLDKDNYSINIKVNDLNFDFIVYKSFNRGSEIVKDVKYYEDSTYKCIFVKYRDDVVLNDVICNNGSYNIAYHNINNKTSGLIEFVDSLSSEGYDNKKWYNDTEKIETTTEGANLYINNMNDDHYLGLVYNNMLFRVNKIDKINPVMINGKNESVYIFAGERLLVINNTNIANYYVYSYTSSKKYKIESDIYIGNMLVLGSYGNSAFVFDQYKNVEYEIDVENKTILQVGDKETNIKYYENGMLKHEKLENLDLNNLNFDSKYQNDYNNPNYSKTIKIGDKSGYYYYFKQINNGYEVYRSSITNKDSLTYLFNTSSIESVKFYDDFIYYIEGNLIKYYSDYAGIRTLISLNTLTDIKYAVYVK